MNTKSLKIEEDILRSFFNIRKKALSSQEYSEVIRTGWTRGNFQNKLILKSVSKPKLLNKLFYLVNDDDFWRELGLSKNENSETVSDKREFFIKLIYIINGLNPTDKTLDDLLQYVIYEIRHQEYQFGNSQEISYRKINVVEYGVGGLMQPLLSLLKESREYISCD